jgi:mannose-6-phosphate isomerase-like protein (cupin superfamily)
MEIVDARAAEVTDNPHDVHASRIYDTDDAQVVYMVLEPGESLKKHITPVDVFFYVLEGTGTIEIGDESKRVGPDNLVVSPARIPHLMSNETGDVFRVLVVKVPRPTESTRLL